ncbi:hypothetical protein [Nitrosopumilus sp.]|uniref:hypothetical protein n=1 Tax=Nitrosopumilus sp. TaxID=2024843 RepID=UPI00247B9B8E|nr:hypothetical protein [Nitrosopumilus sp.]MCV0431373.1 hypothetical protein [Nitrosopumilus sp.]
MSQIIQIAKESTSRASLKMNDAKNASLFRVENNAEDIMGLSWMILDYPTLHLAQPERRCTVTG